MSVSCPFAFRMEGKKKLVKKKAPAGEGSLEGGGASSRQPGGGAAGNRTPVYEISRGSSLACVADEVFTLPGPISRVWIG